MKMKMFFAGSGGQGAIAIGLMIAKAAMEEGKEVTWMPSYGPEMRGGTANCTVIVSDNEISCPVIYEADVLVAMNLPSLRKFESRVRPGGWIFINSSTVLETSLRKDVHVIRIPANEKAQEIGNDRAANMVILGAVLSETKCCEKKTIVHQLEKTFSGEKAKYLPANKAALNLYCS